MPICKVSICIPAYNNGVYIERLFNSIIQQSYKDFEVVITDDSNPMCDDVYNVINKYKDKIKIGYYRNKVQLGPTKNCNKAISLAQGEYIKIMHHDDWFTDQDSLEKFVMMMQNNKNIGFAFSGTRQVSLKKTYERHILPKQVKNIRKDWRNVFLGNYIGAPSATIFRNEGWKFDDNLKWCVDYELYMRILRKNSAFEYTELPLICIGESDTQVTQDCMADYDLRYNEYKYVYKKFKLYQKPRLFCSYLFETLTYKISKKKR